MKRLSVRRACVSVALLAGLTALVVAGQQGDAGPPVYEAGARPSTLGWGPDDRGYPSKLIVNAKDGAEMVWVPPGEFVMGSTEEEVEALYRRAKGLHGGSERLWFQDAQPAHRVRITRGFWLYRHEVTNAQYRRFRPEHNSGEHDGLSLDGDEQPVVQVSWADAKAYSDWAEGALPTEAQWEYACRAGSKTRYWWGDSEEEAGRHANVSDRTAKARWDEMVTFDTDDGHAATAPVGSYAANAFGLQDMLGNVCEWCADWYGFGYYAEAPRDDPAGPERGDCRVVRGGSWISVTNCYSASRGKVGPTRSGKNAGFRCAKAP